MLKLLDVQKLYGSGKKFKAIFEKDGERRFVRFGQAGSFTFIDGAGPDVRDRYRARHKNDNINDAMSPGALSWFITWGDSRDIDENIKNFKKKFNV
jgi:hypothetical protein